MAHSAISNRQERTLASITSCARSLTDARGLDGFTMDDLADCAGVSRRTLFNYVPSKVDAVLAFGDDVRMVDLAVFVAKGPTGHLVQDIRVVLVNSLQAKDTTAAEIEQIRRLIGAEPRLLAAVHQHMAAIVGFLADAIVQREGAGFDPAKARIAATLALAMFDEALATFVADPSATLAEHYGRVVDAAVSLFD